MSCFHLFPQSLAAAVCVCVESTANTPGIPIFGIQRLRQRGRRSISVQHLVKKACGVHLCVLLSNRMRRDFCECKITNGALFSIIRDLSEEQSKVVSERGTWFDCIRFL